MSEGYIPTPPMEEGSPPGEEGDEEARRHQATAQEVEAQQAAEREGGARMEGAQQAADAAAGQPVTSVGPQQRPSQKPDDVAVAEERTAQQEASEGRPPTKSETTAEEGS